MNNQGWGLKTMVVFTCILLFALIFAIIQIQIGFNNINNQINPSSSNNNGSLKPTYQSYEDIEYAMIKATASYVNKYYSTNFLEGDYITVPLKVLVSEKFIDSIYDLKDKKIKCSGYVGFIKENNIIEYEPYLKCDNNYTTKGYIERHDDL